jgi:hypothetical protein
VREADAGAASGDGGRKRRFRGAILAACDAIAYRHGGPGDDALALARRP